MLGMHLPRGHKFTEEFGSGGTASPLMVRFHLHLVCLFRPGVKHQDVDIFGIAQGEARIISTNCQLREHREFTRECDGVFRYACHGECLHGQHELLLEAGARDDQTLEAVTYRPLWDAWAKCCCSSFTLLSQSMER